MFSLIVHISLTAATATVEGKMSKSLKKVLKKIVAKDIHQELAIADAKLGGVIKVSKINTLLLCSFYLWALLIAKSV